MRRRLVLRAVLAASGPLGLLLASERDARAAKVEEVIAQPSFETAGVIVRLWGDDGNETLNVDVKGPRHASRPRRRDGRSDADTVTVHTRPAPKLPTPTRVRFVGPAGRDANDAGATQTDPFRTPLGGQAINSFNHGTKEASFDGDVWFTTDTTKIFTWWNGASNADYDTSAAFQTGEKQEAAGAFGDPGLAADFNPNKGALVVDRAIVLPEINDGFVGSAPDVGAYELGGATGPGSDAGTSSSYGSSGSTAYGRRRSARASRSTRRRPRRPEGA